MVVAVAVVTLATMLFLLITTRNNNRFTPKYENDDDKKKIEWVGFKVNFNVNDDNIPEGQFTYESLVKWGRETLASVERVLGKESENQFLRTGKLLLSLNDPSNNPTSNDTNATQAEETLHGLLMERRKPKPTKPKPFTEEQLFAGLELLRAEILEYENKTDESRL